MRDGEAGGGTVQQEGFLLLMLQGAREKNSTDNPASPATPKSFSVTRPPVSSLQVFTLQFLLDILAQ